MADNCAVILAGGEGTRMKSQKPKVMAELLFRPMIDHVIAAARAAGINDVCVVTGYKAELLEAHLATAPRLCGRPSVWARATP